MPDKRDQEQSDQHESCGEPDSSVTGKAGEAGRGVADAAAGVAGLGTGLLGGLAGALGGLVGGLTGGGASTRRTKIHPWELPSEPEADNGHERRARDKGKADEYDEDYDRIH